MTTRTMSAETAPVPGSSGEASGGTEWDSMRGSVPDGGPLPPSFPPSTDTESIASPTDMDGESAIDTDAGEETPAGASGAVVQTPEGAVVQTPEDAVVQTPEGAVVQTPEGAEEQTDESTSYENRGRQIIAGATEHARTGSKELFNRAKAGIKGIASILVRLARGGAKTVGEAAGKGASVAVGFAAIEGPKAAKATAKKVSELAVNARNRRELRKSNREAAKTSRKLEYEKRQQARKTALGKIATRNQEIKDDSDERSTGIETDKANISRKKGELKTREVAAKAAKSEARKAERRLKRLTAKKEKAQDRHDRAKKASENNPDDTRAQAAFKRAERDLEAAKSLYDAELNYKTELDSERADRFSEAGRSRQALGELQKKVSDAKRDNNGDRVERLENAGVSAFLRVAEFVDGPTAAHDLLRRAGRAIRLKFQGGNRQEAKTAA